MIVLSLELPEEILVEKHNFDGTEEKSSWSLFSCI